LWVQRMNNIREREEKAMRNKLFIRYRQEGRKAPFVVWIKCRYTTCLSDECFSIAIIIM